MARKRKQNRSKDNFHEQDDEFYSARAHPTDIVCIAILAFLVVLFFLPAITGGKVFFAGDVMNVYNPYQAINAEELNEGRMPLWTDRFFCGFPLFAESQGALFYPPTRLAYALVPVHLAFTLDALFHFFLAGLFMYILARSLGQRPVAALVAGSAFALSGLFCSLIINFTIFRSAIWIPLIFYLYRRSLLDHGILWPVLLAISLVMQMMGGSVQVTAITLLLVAIDGIYLAAVKLIQGDFLQTLKRVLKIVFAVGFAIGLYAFQLLPTWELTALSQRGVEASYEIAASYSYPPEHLIDIAIPNFFGDASKGTDIPGANVAPNYFAYIGIIALGLAIFGAGTRRSGLLWPIALLFVLLALGPAGKLFDLVYDTIPLFDKFRAPDRFLMVFVFATTLLAGFGAERIASRDDPVEEDEEDEYEDVEEIEEVTPGRWKYIALLVLILIVAVIGALPWLGEGGKAIFDGILLKTIAIPSGITIDSESLAKYEKWRNWVPFVILYFTVFAAAIPLCNLIMGRRAGGRGIVILFLILNCLDLYFIAGTNHNSKLIDGTFFSRKARHMPKSAAYILENAPESRIYSFARMNHARDIFGDLPVTTWYQGGGGDDEDYFRFREILSPNLSAYYGLYDAGGFASLFTEDFYLFDGIALSQLMDIANGRNVSDTLANGKPLHLLIDTMAAEYIVSGVELPDGGRFSLVHEGDVRIYKNNLALPRAYIVHPASVLNIDEKNIVELAAAGASLGGFDFETRIILPPGASPSTFAESEAGISTEIRPSHLDPGNIKLEVQLDRPGVLVLADAYYPGWEAYVDGQETEIHRANLYFRGLLLDEPGKHTVEFRFNPLSFRRGKIISIISLIMLLTVAVAFHLFRDWFDGAEDSSKGEQGTVSVVRYGLFGRKIVYDADDEDEL